MASPIHELELRGGALAWVERSLHAVSAFAPHDDDEPPTVRSAPAPLAQSGELPCAPEAADRDPHAFAGACSADVADEEPCPATLRSPVSEGASTNIQRPRVA